MKKLCLMLLMTFSLIPFPPSNTTFAKGKQTPITDTVADRHSIYSALYKTANERSLLHSHPDFIKCRLNCKTLWRTSTCQKKWHNLSRGK